MARFVAGILFFALRLSIWQSKAKSFVRIALFPGGSNSITLFTQYKYSETSNAGSSGREENPGNGQFLEYVLKAAKKQSYSSNVRRGSSDSIKNIFNTLATEWMA